MQRQQPQNGTNYEMGAPSSSAKHGYAPQHHTSPLSSSSLSFSLLSASLLAVVPLFHLVIAPYTKVEESFTLHAAHDIVRSLPLHEYDHISNPGPIPRSFIPPALLALPLRFVSCIWSPSDPFEIQLLLRAVLAVANAIGLFFFINRSPQPLRLPLLLLSVSQFHFPFWSSRTIPNSLALPFVHVSLALVLFSSSYSHYGLAVLVFIGVIFRIEIAVLVFVLFVYLLLSARINLSMAFCAMFPAALISISLSLSVDSFMWSHFPLVPELSSFLFNVVEGKSAQWGVFPFHSYFTQFLPKLLLVVYPLALIGIFANRFTRTLMGISLSYVTLLSFLGHKEWRFIIYVVPLFNLSAIQTVYSTISSIFFRKLVLLALIGSTLMASTIPTLASVYNYPGGDAMALIRNNLYAPPANLTPFKVHLDVNTKMTGASLFTHAHDIRLGTGLWTYNRTETLNPSNPTEYDSFDVIVTSNPTSLIAPNAGFHVLATVPGYAGLRRKPLGVASNTMPCMFCAWLPIEMAIEDQIWILGRIDEKLIVV